MDYQVRLEAFEGPLDLLLHLIEKNKVDIYDIPIAVITDQYLAFVADSAGADLENLADFLLMAATLVSIKSRMLLPRHEVPDEDEEAEEDPREQLVQRLTLYRQYKELASHLAAREEGEEPRVYYREISADEQEEVAPVEVRLEASISDLVKAFQALWQEKTDEFSYPLPQGDVDVGEKIAELLQRLPVLPDAMVFQDLFWDVCSRREALALFLALLELVRQQRVRAVQEEHFGCIVVGLRPEDENAG